jgi:AcrR family transcriptional regulator
VSPRRSGADTREHVLEVAHELFYWRGIRATGVDAVAAEAGVAPTTLYRLFASKDDLVAAYVERASRLYREWFDDAAGAGAGTREHILAVFDALAVQVRPENCRGCPFLMALTEFPEEHLAAHRHAVAVKAWVRRRFAELGAPDDLADDLALVMEGVYASVQALGVDGPARRARRLAEALLDDRGLTSSPG